MNENKLREQICLLATSIFDRGLTHGSTGNISVRLDDNNILVTPSGSSFGRLDPNQIVKVSKSGEITGSTTPTKELPLHQAFYETRGMKSGAVVHLHSTYSVALSMMPGINEDNVLPSYTPYSVMLLGNVKLLPFLCQEILQWVMQLKVLLEKDLPFFLLIMVLLFLVKIWNQRLMLLKN